MAKYQNAKRGVSKLFAAAMLEIISTILAAIAVAVGLNNHLENVVLTAVAALMGVAAIIIAVIALIINIVGLRQAGKDEPNLEGAFIVTIATLVIAVLGGVLSLIPNIASTVSRLVEIISSIFELSIIMLVCNGIANIFRAKGKEKLAKRGKTIIILAVIAFVVAVLFRGATLATFAPDQIGNIILFSIGGACEIVGYIMYLVYLHRAKKDF